MSKIERLQLLGGSYNARSIIADAQKCINLYPEKNPEDAEVPYTNYPTPGLERQLVPVTSGPGRGLYTATNGRLYAVIEQKVIYIDSNFVQTVLGTLSGSLTTPVGMVDNGNVLVIVDGSTNGYAVDLVTNAFGVINDPSFLGATNVDYVDTFMVFNVPGTKNFYSTLSNVTFADLTAYGEILTGSITAPGSGGSNNTYTNVPLTGGSGSGAEATIVVTGGAVTSVTITDPGELYNPNDVLSASIAGPLTGFTWTVSSVQSAFDPTYIAAKTGFPDQISTLTVVHREIWLFGIVKTAEVWYDAGGAQFPFQIIPGVFLEHGCVAPYSVQKHDLLVFWLGIDSAGQGTVYMGAGYEAKKISTYAIANEISKYSTISDAIGMMYKQGDHVFYILTFPDADKTWVYDLSENLWHQRTWLDPETGIQHRHRANCFALAYGLTLCADWENGSIYRMSKEFTTDFDGPIVRTRGFPHSTFGLNRTSYPRFMADMECGNGITEDPNTIPQVTLRISDNRGRTFREAPLQSLGLEGEYYVLPTWHQLGMARDRVFELSWAGAVITALNGAYVDIELQVPPGT